MDVLQQQALALIKGALTGNKCVLSDKPDMDALLKLAHKHNIGALMYHALLRGGYENEPITQQLFFQCQVLHT